MFAMLQPKKYLLLQRILKKFKKKQLCGCHVIINLAQKSLTYFNDSVKYSHVFTYIHLRHSFFKHILVKDQFN